MLRRCGLSPWRDGRTPLNALLLSAAVICPSSAQFDHFRALGVEEPRPSAHQVSALLEQVTSLVGAFGFVSDDVTESELADFSGDGRSLRCPLSE